MKTGIGPILLIVLFGASIATAQQASRTSSLFERLDANGDGKLTPDEATNRNAFRAGDANRDGTVTQEEFRAYMRRRQVAEANKKESVTPPDPIPAPERPGEPPLKKLSDSDAVRDAAGRGQLFECCHVDGLTNIREGMNGFAIADLNGDGLPDVIATFSQPRSFFRRANDKLRVLINEGNFRFRPHSIAISASALAAESFGKAAQIPNLADFNGDGWLDIVVTRSAPSLAGKVREDMTPTGTAFLLSDGSWDKFVDVTERMGAHNKLAYNRQTSFGDVNGDGWLDIAIGCDNIKNALGGVPHSRLYIFKPDGDRFEDGRFEDIGGTDLVPDFGGFYHDSARDKAGPGISLRDLDNDGDLDLLQSYHVDVRGPQLPYSPGEYRQGMMCWKNLQSEARELRFEKVTGNGLHCEARLKYNREKELYEPASKTVAPGLPYVSVADVDHDGLLDVLAVGPDSDYWAPRIEHVTGRFWRNSGKFQFQDQTREGGFGPINNTYGEWMAFFEEPIPPRYKNWKPRIKYESQPGKTPTHPMKQRPYFADSIFGDFDNDGWLDVVVMNRSERPGARSMLFMGKGDGEFEVKSTTFSGLDSSGISGEAADLDGDGLLDLVFAADPDNSSGGREVAPSRYESKVYWNTGEHGARDNHWLRLVFSGIRDAELIGARVELIADGKKQYRWVHSNHTYKSGGALDAHFGLGKATSADVSVKLLSGTTHKYPGLSAGETHTLEITEP